MPSIDPARLSVVLSLKILSVQTNCKMKFMFRGTQVFLPVGKILSAQYSIIGIGKLAPEELIWVVSVRQVRDEGSRGV